MRELAKCDYDRAGYIISLSQARAAHVLAEYRARDEAPLRAEIERLREALERVVDHAEDWHAHYCELWGERRKEQQDAILGDILNARAALAPSAPAPRESTEPLREGDYRTNVKPMGLSREPRKGPIGTGTRSRNKETK